MAPPDDRPLAPPWLRRADQSRRRRPLTLGDLQRHAVELQRDVLAEQWHERLADDGPLCYLGSLACALRAARAQAGMSQRAMADAAGVSHRAVELIESGGGTRWDTVLRLLAAARCRLLVVDANGRPLLPLRHEGVLDAAGRELPPHLSPRVAHAIEAGVERRRPWVRLPPHRLPRWTYGRRAGA
jgi:transcriptional regulator with XRE-family HTH domain